MKIDAVRYPVGPIPYKDVLEQRAYGATATPTKRALWRVPAQKLANQVASLVGGLAFAQHKPDAEEVVICKDDRQLVMSAGFLGLDVRVMQRGITVCMAEVSTPEAMASALIGS